MEVVGVGPKHSEMRHESDISGVVQSADGLTIFINTVTESGQRIDLKVHFQWVRGYRYLDEGDLQYYWKTQEFTVPQHVFRILSGGWSNGEALQPDTLSVSTALEIKEWFIATTNGCMNVLSGSDPTVEYVNA
ncbi:hypothetical protein [Marinobacter confluentis]|uniref:Uncharacterized protein n=1 Tax=Marinobacter confluentis TaxID=1697557 RepID=A0A4Z1CE07_9GAMM|nr:hypothetical protein [Marinobacter confluentis]TGN37918.1 hypothetical protein E5Q11_17260 [Marinobacter confluentis]